MQLIASMTTEMEIRHRRASASVMAHTELLTQARLLLEATMTFRNALSAIRATMSSTLSEFEDTDYNGTVALGTELTTHCHRNLDSTVVAMQQAEKVHAQAIDRLQVALIERDMANKSATAINACISILTQANQEEQRELGHRNLCGLPVEIWAQILAEVTRPDGESPKSANPMPHGWAHGSRAMLLASVCREWRDLAVNTKALWSTINVVPVKQSTNAISRLVELHLSRMGPLPCNMVISVDTEITTKETYTSLKPVFARVKELRQLRFYLHYSARHLVCLFYGMLPTPADLVLETTDAEGARYVYLPLAEGAPKKLSLVSCELLGSCTAPLTHVEVTRTDGSYYDFGEWRQGSIETLEHAVLRYKNSRVDSGAVRLTAPRLRYLETSTSLLTNRLLSLYDMPNLQELVITDTEGHASRPWEDIAIQLGKEARLEKMTVDTEVGDGVQKLVGSLVSLPTVTTLELRGKSVKSGLEKLDELLSNQPSPVRNLQTVIITDYLGDGKEILGKAGMVRIETLNCPNLSKEVRQDLMERRRESQ